MQYPGTQFLFEFVRIEPKHALLDDQAVKELSVKEYDTRKENGNWPPLDEELWTVFLAAKARQKRALQRK